MQLVENRKGLIVKTVALLMVLILCSTTLGSLGVEQTQAADTVAPGVTKTANPTSINIAGSGIDEETTVTITVEGSGQDTSVDVKLDVVFAIDSSGSMASNDPTGLRKEASKNFVDLMDPSQDQAGVVSWDSDVDFSAPLSNDFDTPTTGIKARIDDVDSSGTTNLNNGLYGAIAVMNGNTRVEESEEVIIFLTDGQGTYTPYGSGGPAADAATAGYVIYSIGLGDSVNVADLTDMATHTGGTYYHATTADALQPIFDAIHQEIVNTVPYNLDVVEVTQSYIIDHANFNIAPDSVVTDGGTGETTITWSNIDGGAGLREGESVVLSFTAKCNQEGTALPVQVGGAAVVSYTDYQGQNPDTVEIPQAYLDVSVLEDKTPRELKQAALAELEQIYDQTDNCCVKKILRKAMCLIEISLWDKYWVDEEHLNPQCYSGALVFTKERQAVCKLEQVKCCDPSLADDLDEVIGMLVKADEMLAATAIADAQQAVEGMEEGCAKTRAERQIERAESAMTKGLEETCPAKAIGSFMTAWIHSHNALRYV